jgi:hypothetical protein
MVEKVDLLGSHLPCLKAPARWKVFEINRLLFGVRQNLIDRPERRKFENEYRKIFA